MSNSCDYCFINFDSNDVKEGVCAAYHPTKGAQYLPSGYCTDCMNKSVVETIIYNKFQKTPEEKKINEKEKLAKEPEHSRIGYFDMLSEPNIQNKRCYSYTTMNNSLYILDCNQIDHSNCEKEREKFLKTLTNYDGNNDPSSENIDDSSSNGSLSSDSDSELCDLKDVSHLNQINTLLSSYITGRPHPRYASLIQGRPGKYVFD